MLRCWPFSSRLLKFAALAYHHFINACSALLQVNPLHCYTFFARNAKCSLNHGRSSITWTENSQLRCSGSLVWEHNIYTLPITSCNSYCSFSFGHRPSPAAAIFPVWSPAREIISRGGGRGRLSIQAQFLTWKSVNSLGEAWDWTDSWKIRIENQGPRIKDRGSWIERSRIGDRGQRKINLKSK